MEVGAADTHVQAVIERLSSFDFDVHRSSGVQQVVLGAIGVHPDFDTRRIRVMPGVAEVYRVTEPYKFASRTWKKEDSSFTVAGRTLGGTGVAVIAGASSVESPEQMHAIAELAARQGVGLLWGGTFKHRTSPYAFPGLGMDGLRMLAEAAQAHNLGVVTQVTDASQIDAVVEQADLIVVGARNMQNYALLQALGQQPRPLMLKRGSSATIDEWLMSAEYILAEGNGQVILCEPGIRTYASAARHTLDLSAITALKARTHLPIFVDPSSGTGVRHKVVPMARAAVAAGADGLLVEVHPAPSQAKSDGPQSLHFEQFESMMGQLRAIAAAIGRRIPTTS